MVWIWWSEAWFDTREQRAEILGTINAFILQMYHMLQTQSDGFFIYLLEYNFFLRGEKEEI